MEKEKKNAAISALNLIKDGQIIGLGTGSTVYYLITELAKLVKGGLDILCIPTSISTYLLAVKLGIKLTTLDEHEIVDITIDGADQIDKNLNLIKGGGGAHTREKILAKAAKKFVVIADFTKYSEILDLPVPIEVLPFATAFVERELRKIGGKKVKLRMAKAKAGPVVTDNGNFILDVDFGEIRKPEELETMLNSIPGVIENGIFSGMVNEVHLGTKDGVRILKPG